MLALKLLIRDWRSGQLTMISLSLVLAVAVVLSVALLSNRVDRALTLELSHYLAADLKISSGLPLSSEYRDKAKSLHLEIAEMAEFSSMLFFNDDNILASIKAVSDNYPLRGELVIKNVFAEDSPPLNKQNTLELKRGEIWVEERIIPLLNTRLGASIEMGYSKLTASKILLVEPDRSSTASVFGARVLMSLADVEQAGVIKSNSRVRHSLLLAGNSKNLQSFKFWFEQHQSELQSQSGERGNSKGSVELKLPEEAQQRVSATLAQGRNFLLLAGSVGLFLAAIALALASQRYANLNTDKIALMKSWGAQSSQLRRLLLQQVLWLAACCSVVGIVLGYLLHLVFISLISSLFAQTLPEPDMQPFITAIMTGFICLLGFTLPAMWHLPSISPLRVLRRDVSVSPSSLGVRIALALTALATLLYYYSQHAFLTALFLASLCITLLLLALFAYILLKLLKSRLSNMSYVFRLAFGNLWRKRWLSIGQMSSLSLCFMLLLLMLSVHSYLTDEWKQQVPKNAHNFFLINASLNESKQISDHLVEQSVKMSDWYSIVRGRLVAINSEKITAAQLAVARGIDREVNFSEANVLPVGNVIEQGTWWAEQTMATDNNSLPRFSIEQKIAQQLNLQLGDIVTFNIGGVTLDAQLNSVRSVQWNNFKPNFFILFEPNTLGKFSPTWMASFYLPPEQKVTQQKLLRQFPTVLLFSVDFLINQLNSITSTMTKALGLLLFVVLICGLVVILAAILNSFQQRIKDIAILRTLGCSQKKILTSLAVEFALIGFIAGVLAALCAILSMAMLQAFVFLMPVQIALWTLWSSPLIAVLINVSLGLWLSYHSLKTPPIFALKSAG